MPVADAALHARIRCLLTGRENLPPPSVHTEVEAWLWSFSSNVILPLLSGRRSEQKVAYGRIRAAYSACLDTTLPRDQQHANSNASAEFWPFSEAAHRSQEVARA